MLGQGTLNPLVTIEARLESRAADFLKCKQRIVNLVNSSNPDVSNQAQILLTRQIDLESQLSGAMTTLQTLKDGSWSFSDILDLTSFALTIETYISSVGTLESQAGVTQTASTGLLSGLLGDLFSGTWWQEPLVLAGAGIFMLWVWKKARK